MWQDHYQSLLNSVKNLEHKSSVTSTLSSIENESIEIRPLDIVNALKSVNKGKPVELMVLLQNILFMLMNAFMSFYLFYLIVLFPMDICHLNS